MRIISVSVPDGENVTMYWGIPTTKSVINHTMSRENYQNITTPPEAYHDDTLSATVINYQDMTTTNIPSLSDSTSSLPRNYTNIHASTDSYEPNVTLTTRATEINFTERTATEEINVTLTAEMNQTKTPLRSGGCLLLLFNHEV